MSDDRPLDATTPDVTAAYSSPDAGMPSLPAGYELLEEIGRGGMGIVYRVRQTALNRVVALKMIRAGLHASEDERARFRVEARAVAALAHPRIVQIYETGEHQGLPFITLEFCAGGSLARKVRDNPLPTNEAAELVRQLAEGVAYAHSRGLVHRDLTPGNVLLTADGQPKIADFGLAKQFEATSEATVVGEGLTQSGVIVGTPSYMAPEQARGRAREAGAAADIWALGAILYRLLTGRPPFQAATSMETLLAVVNDEPVPPRQLAPRLPRDLETICLKCLQKDPVRRYASAQELADDLARFLRHEPIRARPVGAVERATKWVRRNPVVAALAAAVVLVLLAGVVTAWALTLHAWDQADKAIQARNDERQRSEELRASRDELEGALARGLLAPLGLQARPVEAEFKALKELAGSTNARLGVRLVAEALDDPERTQQLRARGTLALQAAIGLDLDRRQQIEELLHARLIAPDTPEGQQLDIVSLIVLLGGVRPETARDAANLLVRRLPGLSNSVDREETVEQIVALARALPPADAEVVLAAASAHVLAGFDRSFDPGGLRVLAVNLNTFNRARSPQAARAATLGAFANLQARAERDADPEFRFALETLAEGLPPEEAGRRWADLAFLWLHKPGTSPDVWQSMLLVAARFDPLPTATRLAATLNDKQLASQRQLIGGFLVDVTKDLGASDRARLCREGVRALLPLLKGSEIPGDVDMDLQRLATSTALQRLANCVPPAESADLLARLLRDDAVPQLSSATGTLVEQVRLLDENERGPRIAEAGRSLVASLGRTEDLTRRADLVREIIFLAQELDTKGAAKLARDAMVPLTDATKRTFDASSLRVLGRLLADLVVLLPAGERARAAMDADALILLRLGGATAVLSALEAVEETRAALHRFQPPEALVNFLVLSLLRTCGNSALGRGLPEAVANLEAASAAKLCADLAGKVAATLEGDGIDHAAFAEALVALSSRIDATQREQLCARAAARVLRGLEQEKQEQARWNWLRALVALAPRRPAAAAVTDLRTALSQVTDAVDQLAFVAEAIADAAPRLARAEAARICREVSAHLEQMLEKTLSLADHSALVEALLRLGAGREPAETLGLYARIAPCCQNREAVHQDLVNRVRALAVRQDPPAARAAVAAALQNAPDQWTAQALADVLGGLTEKLPEGESRAIWREVNAALLRREAAATEIREREAIAGVIASAASPQPVPEGAALLKRILSRLAPTHSLMAAVERLAPRLTPAEVVALYLLMLERLDEGYFPPNLSEVVASVLARLEAVDPEAARLATEAAVRALLAGLDRKPGERAAMAAVIAALANRLTEEQACRIAPTLFRGYSYGAGNLDAWSVPLRHVLMRQSPATATEQALGAILLLGPRLGEVPALMLPLVTPPPPPLPEPRLVELLRHPNCIDDVRRVVLDQLERHHGRPFADQWDYQRFARTRR
jgi:hypothetical protein